MAANPYSFRAHPLEYVADHYMPTRTWGKWSIGLPGIRNHGNAGGDSGGMMGRLINDVHRNGNLSPEQFKD